MSEWEKATSRAIASYEAADREAIYHIRQATDWALGADIQLAIIRDHYLTPLEAAWADVVA